MSDGWNGNRHDPTAQNLHRPTTRRRSVTLPHSNRWRRRCTNAFYDAGFGGPDTDLNQNTAPCRAAPSLLAERQPEDQIRREIVASGNEPPRLRRASTLVDVEE